MCDSRWQTSPFSPPSLPPWPFRSSVTTSSTSPFSRFPATTKRIPAASQTSELLCIPLHPVCSRLHLLPSRPTSYFRDVCRWRRVENTCNMDIKGSCWREAIDTADSWYAAALHDETRVLHSQTRNRRCVELRTVRYARVTSHHLCNWQEIWHYKLLHKQRFHIYLCTTVTNLYTSLKGNVYI